MMNRRSLLAGIAAVLAAPAVVRADSLMRVVVPPPETLFTLWGDGVHDDTAAIQAMIDGRPVVRAEGASWAFGGRRPDGTPMTVLCGGIYLVSAPIEIGPGKSLGARDITLLASADFDRDAPMLRGERYGGVYLDNIVMRLPPVAKPWSDLAPIPIQFCAAVA